jgi:hypothetical protein
MCLIELAFLLAGVLLLVFGKLPLGRISVQGVPARIMGGVLIFPLLAMFLVGFVDGFRGRGYDPEVQARYYNTLGNGLFPMSVLIAVMVAVLTAKRMPPANGVEPDKAISNEEESLDDFSSSNPLPEASEEHAGDFLLGRAEPDVPSNSNITGKPPSPHPPRVSDETGGV